MNKKLLLELSLLTIFVLADVCTLFKVPYASIVTLTSGGLLSMLYFYGSYWLYAQSEMHPIVRIAVGFSYSTVVVFFIFGLLHWPFWHIYGIVAGVGLAAITTICLWNYKLPAYKTQLYRCILFLITGAILYGYRYFIV
jgi:hypothetical protein